jgi:glucokinase
MIEPSMTTIGAIDIGGTKIAVGMVDENGRVLGRMEIPSKSVENYGDGLEQIASMLRNTARIARVEIAGIGIGSTGPVHPFTGRFGDLDFLPRWRGESLVDDLAQIFRVPVALENDADAAALAEANWGAGKSKSRFIYVTIGTGIGGGIILDGQLYRGVDAAHPEIGHQVIDIAGPPCSCGFNGCWESMAAGPAMVKWMESQPDCPAGEALTAKRICELAFAGNALALRTVERETFYLGLGLANLVNLFTPDAVILSGSVMKSSALFLEGIHKVMRQGCRFIPLDKVELTLASLGEDANLIGAARVWHYRSEQNANALADELRL